ncbi:squalene synthase HpnC [Methylovirgula sp. 4M-Z18]|uniref:squalene synthase HpnC n=1 Tax=Methylovirgula sp. 4M-Z18 TaxID=2293567 RepID=UPI000E2FE5D6|nr:squalene synthase HpnC [Methylovirgula sp. 4M-Z18]RFB76562.1 squalene synthase HpnC [Methylovirgula sp. 4M-Z18]
MDSAGSASSGKGARDENFPVASWLIAKRHRPAIMAFYNFVRTADDVADHATLPASEKLRLLDQLEASLLGHNDKEPTAIALRSILAERNLTPAHACDLIAAFKIDASKSRYEDWDALIGYCRLSAMPVGRYVLDVHGESQNLWPANDALCAALQIINHLQDCSKDYRALDRVYLPLDDLRAAGAQVSDLGLERASPALRHCLSSLAARTEELLGDAASFSRNIRSTRLSLEVAIIHRLATRLVELLKYRDPLSERVHLDKSQTFMITASTLISRARFGARKDASNVRLLT